MIAVSVVNYAVKDTSFHLHPGKREWKFSDGNEKSQPYMLKFLGKRPISCDRQAKVRKSDIMSTPLILG